MSLREKTINGVIWTSLDKFMSIGLGVVVNILIARVLSPKDYGLYGMLAFFSGLGTILIDSGFGQALIRKSELTEDDLNTVFYFNIVVGGVVYLALFFAAPFIAIFFKEPVLDILSKIVFLNIAISSFGIVQSALFQKKLQFDKITKANLVSLIVGSISGVSMAFAGYGYWALVGQHLVAVLFRVAALWYQSDWFPRNKFSFSSLKEFYSYGSKLMLSGIIYQFTGNIYQVFIGKYYDAFSVGLYTQASKLQQIPASNLDNVIQSVTFPVLSAVQDDELRLKQAFRKILKQVIFVNFPILSLLGVVSKPFISVLITDKWIEAAPLLSLMAIVGLFYPVHSLNMNILKVKGRTDLFLYLDIIKNVLLVLTALFTYQISVVAMVIGLVCYSLVALLINCYFGGRVINYTIKEQFSDMMPNLLLVVVIAGIVYGLKLFIVGSLALLSTQIVLFVILYITASVILDFDAWREIKILFLERLNLYAK